jgi:hypothetical protein
MVIDFFVRSPDDEKEGDREKGRVAAKADVFFLLHFLAHNRTGRSRTLDTLSLSFVSLITAQSF